MTTEAKDHPVPVTAREAFEHLLCHGGARVALYGRAAGVELPEHVRDLDPLVLEYGLDLPTRLCPAISSCPIIRTAAQ